MAKYADPATVEVFAAGLKEEHLRCRTFGHKWDPYTAKYVAEDKVYECALRCSRCKTRRPFILSLSGEILTSHYRYPDGYLAKHLGRIVGDGRDALRLESILRMVK